MIFRGLLLQSLVMSISSAAHWLSFPVSNMFIEGYAKVCGFQILRHGTAWPNYCNIVSQGTNPNLGGSTSSFHEGVETSDPCYGRFHVFKDSDNALAESVPLIGDILKRVMPHIHSGISGMSYATSSTSFVAGKCIFGAISGLFHLVCAPTLQFIYRKEELAGIFEVDPDYGNLALRTHAGIKLENDRIGFAGLIHHASKADALRTWEQNPGWVLIGVVQMAVGGLFTISGLGFFI